MSELRVFGEVVPDPEGPHVRRLAGHASTPFDCRVVSDGDCNISDLTLKRYLRVEGVPISKFPKLARLFGTLLFHNRGHRPVYTEGLRRNVQVEN